MIVVGSNDGCAVGSVDGGILFDNVGLNVGREVGRNVLATSPELLFCSFELRRSFLLLLLATIPCTDIRRINKRQKIGFVKICPLIFVTVF